MKSKSPLSFKPGSKKIFIVNAISVIQQRTQCNLKVLVFEMNVFEIVTFMKRIIHIASTWLQYAVDCLKM